MTTQHLTIRTLNGETLAIDHLASRGLQGLMDDLYQWYPEIPLGCIDLRRFLPDREEDEVLNDEEQMLRMGETLVDIDLSISSTVTALLDGMELAMFANPRLVEPVFTCYSNLVLYTYTKDYDYTADPCVYIESYSIEFYKGEHLASSISFVCNYDRNLFGLYEDIERCYSSRSTSYVPKPTFQWYTSLAECLRAAPQRIPKDETCFEHLQSLFATQTWRHSYGPNDDEDDEYDDEPYDYVQEMIENDNQAYFEDRCDRMRYDDWY